MTISEVAIQQATNALQVAHKEVHQSLNDLYNGGSTEVAKYKALSALQKIATAIALL